MGLHKELQSDWVTLGVTVQVCTGSYNGGYNGSYITPASKTRKNRGFVDSGGHQTRHSQHCLYPEKTANILCHIFRSDQDI